MEFIDGLPTHDVPFVFAYYSFWWKQTMQFTFATCLWDNRGAVDPRSVFSPSQQNDMSSSLVGIIFLINNIYQEYIKTNWTSFSPITILFTTNYNSNNNIIKSYHRTLGHGTEYWRPTILLDPRRIIITGSTLRNDSSTRRLWTSISCWRRAPCTNLNPILGVTCKISLTILSRELLSISLNVWLVKPNSCLRLRKVLSETFRFLAMVVQWNPDSHYGVLPKDSLKYEALGQNTTPTPPVDGWMLFLFLLFMQTQIRQDAVWAYIWAWSYYGYDTLNMPYCS